MRNSRTSLDGVESRRRREEMFFRNQFVQFLQSILYFRLPKNVCGKVFYTRPVKGSLVSHIVRVGKMLTCAHPNRLLLNILRKEAKNLE